MHAHETNATEDCFSTTAGRYLRSRCCVYFSNVAGSLIHSRFGTLRARGGRQVGSDGPPPLRLTYELMAKWLLSNANDPLAITVGAELVDSIAILHQRARRLPGPTGLYAADIKVAGVQGKLIKCEMGTVHTYLIFTAPGQIEDVLIDLTYRQFLVVGEWMSATHFAAIERADLFRGAKQWFVGTNAVFEADVVTLDSLRGAMHQTYELAGEDAGNEEQRLEHEHDVGHMHDLLRQMFGLGYPTVRQLRCGKPNQALGMA